MKIGYRAQGTGTYTTLGDDSTSDLVSGFLPKMSGEPQVRPLAFAANASVLARGNRKWSIEGIVEKVHASLDAAAAFIQSQAAAIPDFVDLQITEGATVIYATPAVLVAFEPVVNGASSRTKYGFVAATITTTAP